MGGGVRGGDTWEGGGKGEMGMERLGRGAGGWGDGVRGDEGAMETGVGRGRWGGWGSGELVVMRWRGWRG